ncbi:MAG: sulfite exporter TauE/SafE family protein [Actinomycetota bacterium]|nr:sulfite exporter TauE/SafE family protein [Actinomycetota bacterium]
MTLEAGPTLVVVLVGALASFILSSAAGLGGSLLLVPTFALIFGTKEGVALAALLLAGNNIMKIVAYRRVLPYRSSLPLVVTVSIGAAIGASILVEAPEPLVAIAVITVLLVSLIAEGRDWRLFRKNSAPVLGFASGITSGISGSSGPLKGVAVRALDLDRMHFIGAASLTSLVGDLSKVGVFSQEALLFNWSYGLAAAAIPLMMIGTAIGRRINRDVGEKGFAVVFWIVMGGYGFRLVAVAI